MKMYSVSHIWNELRQWYNEHTAMPNKGLFFYVEKIGSMWLKEKKTEFIEKLLQVVEVWRLEYDNITIWMLQERSGTLNQITVSPYIFVSDNYSLLYYKRDILWYAASYIPPIYFETKLLIQNPNLTADSVLYQAQGGYIEFTCNT